MSRRRAAVPLERDDESRDDPVTGAEPGDGRLVGYRLIRRIAVGERADLFLAAAEVTVPPVDDHGVVPTESHGEAAPSGPRLVVLRVYRSDAPDASITLEVEAMDADVSGTLPTLHDVANLDDGRCALAVERIGGGSLSRLLADRPLAPGEAVTILAPIVVAVAELARRGFVHTRLAPSDVLIDDRGRPRLVGLGALQRLPERPHADRTALLRAGHAALAALVADVAAAVRPVGAIDAATELIRERLEARPFQPCEAELERRLFEAAAPEPIGGVELRPRSGLPARAIAPSTRTAAEAAEATDVGARPAPRRAASRGGGLLRSLVGLAQLPDDLASTLAAESDVDRIGRARRRLLELARSRGRTLTFGGLVGGAALVLLLTLVPPATAGTADGAADAPGDLPRGGQLEEADAASSSSATGAPPTGAPDAAGATGSGALGGEDPIAAAAALLERRAECFRTLDLSCLDDVVQPGSTAEAEERASLLTARDGGEAPDAAFDLAALTVTTEMGGAVLVSAPWIDAEREPASLLLVRGEAGWRLREMFG